MGLLGNHYQLGAEENHRVGAGGGQVGRRGGAGGGGQAGRVREPLQTSYCLHL